MSGRQQIVVRDHWGASPPDWIAVLAEECDRAGLRPTAHRIGMSASVVNETLRHKYKGRLDNVEAKVRGAFMGSTVQCPVLDEIAVDLCIENQRRRFSSSNPTRVALHRACQTCKHNRSTHSPSASPKDETP